MSKPIPRISQYMTATPHTVGRDQPLTVAHRLMRDHRVRHLPVVHVGKLVGLVSDRDLALIETLRDVNPAEVIVEEAMTQAPYTVGPDASLAEVAEHMAAHRYGSCVVVDGERVVGVFTTVDALEALAALLRSATPG
jgi:acetoin utilization protein AcuB